jgi:hypothetical protein
MATWRNMAAVLAPLLALGGLAHAEDLPSEPTTPSTPAASAPEDGKVVYAPDFFTQYSPQTALDMVARVPGFSIDSGSDRRGFSGTAGNVLIDGARPSSKSEDIRSILDRIPVNQVARLELIRAASTGEAAGQSVLVNVVRNATAGAGSGTYELELERTSVNRVDLRGGGSYSGKLGAMEYTVGANRFAEQRPVRGYRYLRDDTNALTGARTDYSPRTFRESTGNLAIKAPLLGGTLNLNTSGGRWNFNAALESVGITPAQVRTDAFRYTSDERQRRREIGGDFERKFGDWTFKAVALDTVRNYANDEQTTFRDASFVTTGNVTQRTRNRSNETIGRLSAAWALNAAHRIEFGGETALNALETSLALTDNGAPIVLPSANVTVEEDRQEGFLTWTWKPTPKWTFESGVTVETSTIEQSGDTSASRTLTYWKPSVQASRQLGRDQLRVKAFRDVSQLDFDDFASSATLLDNSVSAGNPDLRPQAKWRLEGVFDHRFGEKGALTLTLAQEWVEDASDLVPIFDPMSGFFFDAPGNIGEGENRIAQIKTTLPVGQFIKGGLFEVYLSYVDTEVTDPTTLKLRPVSSNSDFYYEIEFRQDLPALKLSWGFEFEKATENRFFRVAESETFEEGPFLYAFVESTRFPRAKVRLFAHNLLDTEFRRERRFFTPNRAGSFVRSEERERQFGRFVGIEVSGNF